eukprot:TRINITY_DN28958_c0_g1_i1.p1 TRINITY_DN28958_c0_g1~~TRINITY_DN28958_c0_g1_i1.p1  ORF type:complete len:620 (-),score=92.15 TRINITY_DN28958_c0_g1_i1:190-2049(-)
MEALVAKGELDVCPYFGNNTLRETFSVPIICDGVSKGDRTVFGLICWPFWDYDAAQILVFFGAVFCLRRYAFKSRRSWKTKEFVRRYERESLSNSSSSLSFTSLGSPVGARVTPLLSNAEQKSILDRTFHFTCRNVRRMVLQIFQWWVFALGLLIFLLFTEIFYVISLYDAQIDSGLHIRSSLNIKGTPVWLQRFAVYSYVALILVYVISLLCIILQVLTHFTSQVLRCGILFESGFAMMTLTRDTSMQVLLLPMVYGLVSAKNVTGTLMVLTNMSTPALECWHWSSAQSSQILSDVYDSNFALGDMYEAWALCCFAAMLAKVLREELQQKIRLEVFHAFQHLLLIDVNVFNLVAATGAIYSISITWIKFRLGYDVCADYPSVCSLQPYLVAANWCVSSIAIYNLFTIEEKFANLQSMQVFRPRLKFFSIKLMVFVAFWMTFVMKIIRDACKLNDDEGKLLDASLRIYVMAIVAVLHIWAWWPWMSWYHMLDTMEEKLAREKMQHRHLKRTKSILDHVGVKHVPPGTTRLVKELLRGLCKDSKNGEPLEDPSNFLEVRQKIEELDEKALQLVLHRGSQFGWSIPAPDSARKSKTPMMLLTHKERQVALLEFIQSFYPEV